jgi:hypothetical protein
VSTDSADNLADYDPLEKDIHHDLTLSNIHHNRILSISLTRGFEFFSIPKHKPLSPTCSATLIPEAWQVGEQTVDWMEEFNV